MDIEIGEGVNYDYILAIEDTDSVLKVVRIPICRNERLVNELIGMCDDTECDVDDMCYAVSSSMHKKYDCPQNSSFKYCLGHKYSDSYITDIKLPDLNEYKKRLASKDNAILRKKEEIDNLPTNVTADIPEILEAKQQKLQQLKDDRQKFISKQKQEYLNVFIKLINALDYSTALQENCIKHKYKSYSFEERGWKFFQRTISDDLEIRINTNFCYGNARYFHVIITYKGIVLSPYSEWVKYYHAKVNEIRCYTRAYKCYERVCWQHCFDFVTSFSNKAMKDPDAFVREEVLYEVNGLISGLEEIFNMSDSFFINELNVSHIAEDDDRYIGISSARHANKHDQERYKIKPSECPMIFRMEKICEALHFLTGLQKLSAIYDEVQIAIDRIIEMNRQIAPEVDKALPPIKPEIERLKRLHRIVDKEWRAKEKQLSRLYEQLNKRLSATYLQTQKNDIEIQFKQTHPLFEKLKVEVQKLSQKVYELEQNIEDRENLKKRLESYQELIKRYTQS